MSSIEKITVNGATYDVGGTKMDEVYPVGSIYMSVKDVDPSELFGGVWARIQDTFLLAAGSSYSAGSTGGAATVTLTTSQIPSHSHSLPSHNHSLPSHTHTLSSHTHSFSATTSSDGDHRHRLYYISASRYATADESGGQRYYAYSETYSNNNTNTPVMSNGAHTHTISGTTGSATPTLSSVSGTSGSVSGTSDTTGGGSSHNNMPPYLAVYMWQRTA